MIRSLGLDLSLTGPGLVLLGKEKGVKAIHTIEAEEIPVPSSQEAGRFERAAAVETRVSAVIDLHKPEIVTIEGYGQGLHRNVQSFIKLVEVGTLVRVVLWGNDLTWTEVPPSSLKLFVTGSGKGSGAAVKKRMIQHCKSRWGFETKNHNIADAYGCARWGLAKQGVIPCEPWQVSALDAVACN